jgi:hypothetical protein
MRVYSLQGRGEAVSWRDDVADWLAGCLDIGLVGAMRGSNVRISTRCVEMSHVPHHTTCTRGL